MCPVLGLFFYLKEIYAQEYEAYRQRYNHLASIAISKKCDIEKEDYMSVQEMQKEYEKQKEQEQESLSQPNMK